MTENSEAPGQGIRSAHASTWRRIRRVLTGVTLEKNVTVGDVLTMVTIIVSITLAMYQWSKDTDLRRQDQADKIRAAAGAALLRFDHWKHSSLSVYEDAEPAFVDAKEMIRKDLDVAAARHYLWKAILQVEVAARQRALEAQGVYVDLYGFNDSARNQFVQAMQELHNREDEAFGKFLMETQDIMLQLETKKVTRKTYSAEMLWNDLFRKALELRAAHEKRLKEVCDPIENGLRAMIVMDDQALLARPEFQGSSTPAREHEVEVKYKERDK